MKTILIAAAAAFAFVTPALAQPAAPAAQGHAGHAEHQGGHADHDGHGTHAQHGQAQGQSQHQGHGAQASCCADANNTGRMDCCENMAAGERCCCAGHQQHGQQPAGQPAPATPQHQH